MILILICSGCARLDHVQINDIDQSQGDSVPISVTISQLGVNAADITSITGDLIPSGGTQESLGDLATVLALINMGPMTGNPIYNDRYAENILHELHQQCPTGRITGIRNIREGLSYGPVSGEIMRINADCIL